MKPINYKIFEGWEFTSQTGENFTIEQLNWTDIQVRLAQKMVVGDNAEFKKGLFITRTK